MCGNLLEMSVSWLKSCVTLLRSFSIYAGNGGILQIAAG